MESDWVSGDGILEDEVDNYQEMGNYEPEEEKKANNVIWGASIIGTSIQTNSRKRKI